MVVFHQIQQKVLKNGQGITWVSDPNNTVDWTNQTGATSSFGTGPSNAFDGSSYMYTETSGGANSEAITYVDCIDPTSNGLNCHWCLLITCMEQQWEL